MYPGYMVELARQRVREQRHEHRHAQDTTAALVDLRVWRLFHREGE